MILLARHGRTAANASGLLLGRADPPLDATGLDQARRLAASLSAERGRGGADVVRILASPLRRTTETASIVAESLGIEVEPDERFIELDYGEWDERPLASVPAAAWAAWRSDVDFAPPGGESLAQLGARVRGGLDALVGAAEPPTAERATLVVSHVSPIKAAVAWAVGGDDAMAWRLFVAPASVTRIAVAGPAPSLHAFNDCAHLA